jgi:hypothetical protein
LLGVVRGEQLPSAMQYCFTDHLIKVFGDPGTGKARVDPGSWAAFKSRAGKTSRLSPTPPSNQPEKEE